MKYFINDKMQKGLNELFWIFLTWTHTVKVKSYVLFFLQGWGSSWTAQFSVELTWNITVVLAGKLMESLLTRKTDTIKPWKCKPDQKQNCTDSRKKTKHNILTKCGCMQVHQNETVAICTLLLNILLQQHVLMVNTGEIWSLGAGVVHLGKCVPCS